MASVKILSPFIFSWEGKYNDRKGDHPTNHGVTLPTWRQYGWDLNHDGKIDKEDVKLITLEDAEVILKKKYWNVCKADMIDCQSIANLIVDFYWNSGTNGIKKCQEVLGVKEDGIIGPDTLKKINEWTGPGRLFALLWARRKKYLEGCPTWEENKNGWMNRMRSIGFGYLLANDLNQTVLWKTKEKNS